MGSPAPAGMVPLNRRVDPSRLGFPRTRGDGPRWRLVEPFPVLVPPHPRGWSASAGGHSP
ncbi:hypothetical protein SP5_077_00040 [Sphingomonas parapaucimobilis NBRC 15100]|uniref:Uncharacterized protein n=1 Tax=Sphingomonas parapaucimobilis NBRC 15100 TaxID=1219049 RepID=A0A0A1WBG0_9SPHN|nr:hypothetical protein SP5_077_00040 [Sphingomonas parapaucimobilis NBRC 15100]